MSARAGLSVALTAGGVPLDKALASLRKLEPEARAFWIYDLDAFEARARRFMTAFAPLAPLAALALKANALPALLERACAIGLGADAVSLGELELARAAGFPSARRVLNGNGRTEEEARWAAEQGVHSVNADAPAELDVLERAAAAAHRVLRVALRVNPRIATPNHPYVATGDHDSKFGMDDDEALAAWTGRARWPHLRVEGLHLHVGSQLVDLEPLEQTATFALDLAARAAAAGAPLAFINLGGGFGVDYEGAAHEFPLERWAERLASLAARAQLEWVLEPGRWLSAPVGMLVAEVLAVKTRGGRRFVVLAAGMNDLIRPALYGARHRVVAVAPRAGEPGVASVVGPVCESADVFDAEALLPPLEPGDLVALMDAGAYGASMASNYNGRGRLAELVVSGGKLTRARAGESAADLMARRTNDALE